MISRKNQTKYIQNKKTKALKMHVFVQLYLLFIYREQGGGDDKKNCIEFLFLL